MKRSTKNRLTEKELFLFPGDILFDRRARAVCRAGTLPRKELFEAWEMARRVRRKFRGGRVVDLACGHGLLAHIMMLLDNSSPTAIAVDTEIPANTQRLSQSIIETWPRLKNRIHYIEKPLQEIELYASDIVVSAHACGTLTDNIIDMAVSVGSRIAVLPCCHDTTRSETGGLEGWLEGPLAVDIMRVFKLKENGYTIMTREIPKEITPKNRLIMAELPGICDSSLTQTLA